MIVDELVTLLEFDVKGKDKAVSFGTIVQKIEESAKKLVLSLTAAVTSVAYFADRVSKEITDNYEWAKSVGVAADSYQRFEHAAEIVGGSLSDIKGDLENWVRTAKASGMTLEEVYAREAKAIEGMSSEQAHALLSARGYSDTSIRMLQKGENELKQYFAQAEVIPEKHLKAAQDYAVTWRQVSSEVSKAMNAAVASALPYLQSLLEGVRKFINVNKELFKSSVAVFFKSLTIVLIAFLTPLRYIIQAVFFLIRAFDKATFGIGKYIVVIGALTAAFTALSIAIAFKTVRSVATLMGLVPQLLAGSIQYFHLINRLVVKLATTNLQEAILNSELAANVKMWWANTVAIWAHTKATAANTIQVIRSAFVAKAHLFTVKGMTIAVQNLVKNIIIGTAKLIPKLIFQSGKLLIQLIRITVILATKLLIFIPKLIFAIGTGLVRGIWQATKAGAAWAISMVGKIVPALVTMGTTIWGAVIPAIGAAATAMWGFTTALLANPITWIVIGVVAAVTELVAEVYLVWKYWDKIVDWLNRAWNTCKGFFNTLYDGCKTIYNWIVDGILKAIDAAWDAGISVAKSIKNFIFGAINDIIDLINLIPGVDIEKVGEVDLTDRDKMMQSIRGQFAPAGTVPVQYTGVAQVPSNNYQNSRSYVDQRNITINTNATSGPAIASYMKSNDLVRGGYGASGVW